MAIRETEAFDPLKLIEDSITGGFDPSLVEEIDERQMDWSPNIVRWTMDAEYCDLPSIYPVQLQVMLKLFGDVCPWCSDWEFFVNDELQVDIPIGNFLDKIQLLEFGKCPKCSRTRLDQYNEGFWAFPEEIDLLWGMRSGKSAVVGVIASYMLHRFLKLPSPAAYFKLFKGSTLVMRFVALTAGQANETIWGQFVRAVENCAWFDKYHDFLAHYEKKHGTELVKWLGQSFGYGHKKLYGYFTGAAIDTSRGRTAAFTAFDEIGWWLGHDQAKRANAHETYEAYKKASATVRQKAIKEFKDGKYDIPTAMIAAVSSTSSKTDYMMRLIRLSKQDRKRVGSHKASWEVNPTFDVAEFESERMSNPKGFMRDYGSVSPYSSDPFLEPEVVTRAVVLDRPEWKVYSENTGVGMALTADAVELQKGIPYCLALDLAKTFCGYAGVLLKLKETDFSVVQVAGLFTIYPQNDAKVDLSTTFNSFVKKMCERLNIRLVLFDTWQSSGHIDELNNAKVASESYSLTYHDFVQFRSQLTQGKLELCKPEITLEEAENSTQMLEEVLYPRPYLHLIWQLVSVAEYGNKVTKGEGHDDIFRALALGCNYLWDEDWRKDFEYKGGMALNSKFGKGGGKGRLVIAGGSLGTGQMYNASAGQTGGAGGRAQVVTGGGGAGFGRPLGAVITRGGNK